MHLMEQDRYEGASVMLCVGQRLEVEFSLMDEVHTPFEERRCTKILIQSVAAVQRTGKMRAHWR